MNNACNYFLNEGFSCSESVVKAAIDKGLVPEELLCVATPFSGGMGSGCLCGAVAGAQIVIGFMFGKNKTNNARMFSKKFIEEFKKIHKTTCCRVLTAAFKDFHSKERKNHCVNMVESACLILDKILEEKDNLISTE